MTACDPIVVHGAGPVDVAAVAVGSVLGTLAVVGIVLWLAVGMPTPSRRSWRTAAGWRQAWACARGRLLRRRADEVMAVATAVGVTPESAETVPLATGAGS